MLLRSQPPTFWFRGLGRILYLPAMTQTSGKLIICPTPLGNLGDVTKRTLEAFSQCDTVCCEDTRVTGKLLAALGIEKRLERLDEASVSRRAPEIVERVLTGEVIGFASDAGMPGVSDPGQRLVDAALDAGACVEVLPGPTAVTTAYVASGFPSQSFYFGAFFPRKAGERVRLLESLRCLDACLVFYESPQRVMSALKAIAQAFPYRRVAVCRELTKLHEEVVRGLSGDVYQIFEEREQQAGIKGEIVLVIDAPTPEEQASDSETQRAGAADRAADLLAAGQLSKKDIVKALREEFGLSRNEAYELVHGA